MKSKINYFLVVLFCYIHMTITGQEQKLDCEFNYREALFYLKGSKNFDSNPQKAIDFLKPCAEKGDSNAQLLLGRIYLRENEEGSDKKAFDLYKKSADQENAVAMADLGIMYKYGRGCKLNYNKARKWFKKSAKLGNDKASYALGYLYLKGFGNIEQDYKKTTEWFKKSSS